MSNELPRLKITVLKRTIDQELIDEYLENPGGHAGKCDQLKDGQEFIVEQIWLPPAGFCAWAWADIRQDLLTAVSGGTFPGMKDPGVVISGCSDWFRPVIFKIETID